MADTDLPKNWEAAARWFLGGTIVFASGFEAVVLFWEGKLPAAGGSFVVAVALMAILIYWDRLKSKLPRVAAALAAAATDARLWAILLLALAAFAGIPSIQGGANTWIYALPLFIGLALFLAAWRYLAPSTIERQHAEETTQPPLQIDGQTRLDLLHLFDVGIDETTIVTLDRLIDMSTGPEATHGSDAEELHRSRNVYIAWVRQHLDGHRRDSYLNVLQNAQFDAEHALREMPLDQRPAGDLLVAREHAISQLQFTRAVQFLGHQKREVEDRLISKRFQLIERRDLRNRGTP